MRRIVIFGYVIHAFWVELLTTIVFLIAVFWGCNAACAQTYELRVQYTNGDVGGGSAVCVGRSLTGRQWVFLTAGHVVDGGRYASVDGYRAQNVRFVKGADLASFEVASGEFEKTLITKEWPDGIQATVCGFPGREFKTCFEGSITRSPDGRGQIVGSSNQTSIPGFSGGPVFVKTEAGRSCLAGVHYGYRCGADINRCESYFVTSEQICQHLTQIYGDCPDCQRWPQVISQPQIPRRQVIQQQPPVRQLPPQSQQVVVAPCQDDIRRMVAEYMQANPVQSGRDGVDGRNGVDGRTPEVDYQRIVGSVLEAIPRPRDGVDGQPGRDGSDGINGSPGQRGPQGATGERGLQGPSGPPPTEGQISAAVIAYINANPERFRGPQGPAGAAGEKGDRYLAVPDDEAFDKRVRQWLETNPDVIERYQQIPEMQQQIEEIKSLLTQQQLVEVQNADGSRFSADTKRRLIDPIILKRPADEQQ